MEDIHLPENIKIVKDLRVSPHARLVLASMGKKLSVLSTESNNTVLTYELSVITLDLSFFSLFKLIIIMLLHLWIQYFDQLLGLLYVEWFRCIWVHR
ncbi:hypothetical protein ACS0TY_029382 [Phlomoides rotata]